MQRLCLFSALLPLWQTSEHCLHFYAYIYPLFTHLFKTKRKTTPATFEVGRGVRLSSTSCPQPSHISPRPYKTGHRRLASRRGYKSTRSRPSLCFYKQFVIGLRSAVSIKVFLTVAVARPPEQRRGRRVNTGCRRRRRAPYKATPPGVNKYCVAEHLVSPHTLPLPFPPRRRVTSLPLPSHPGHPPLLPAPRF